MASMGLTKAELWHPASDGGAVCGLCSHHCAIKRNACGLCGVRRNEEGTLVTLVYDKVAALNLDPIEKKPLYHFLPGTTSLSLGTMGCNMGCSYCQNYQLSQPPRQGQFPRGESVTPKQLVDTAIRMKAASISYTYSEPTIFFELAHDTGVLALQAGLRNVWVTNGFMTVACLKRLKGLVQAVNIDLKSFTDDFYRNQCGARLAPVLRNAVMAKSLGIWVELTTLLIPGLNDSEAELRDMAAFIASDLGRDTPWHISRFHPTYQLTDRGATPVARLEQARAIGHEAGLSYVYVGNVPTSDGETTQCPQCGTACLKRKGFSVVANSLHSGGACPNCGHLLAGIWV